MARRKSVASLGVLATRREVNKAEFQCMPTDGCMSIHRQSFLISGEILAGGKGVLRLPPVHVGKESG